MQSSPCIELQCELKDQDKNNPVCLNCSQRMRYTALLGAMTDSVPLALSDMAAAAIPENLLGQEEMKHEDRYWCPEEEQFLKQNYLQMSNDQMAAELKRGKNAVAFRMHKLGLRRREFKRGLKAEKIDGQEKAQPASDSKLPSYLQKDYFILDFKECAHLYDELIETARREFRDPGAQALWYIKCGLAASNGNAVSDGT